MFTRTYVDLMGRAWQCWAAPGSCRRLTEGRNLTPINNGSCMSPARQHSHPHQPLASSTSLGWLALCGPAVLSYSCKSRSGCVRIDERTADVCVITSRGSLVSHEGKETHLVKKDKHHGASLHVGLTPRKQSLQQEEPVASAVV
ncbi:hypothetical protein O3P69_020536 [Scylla paramamosain]|uniref:Uncharacterized protein n=1 Tax=Scylla paramamosain TaxID=85552 RepID=A0AAW0TPK2_SCYPA